MRFDAFCGGSNTTFSQNVSSEDTINWIAERNPQPVAGMGTELTDKNERCALIRTPGTLRVCTFPLSPVRGIFPGAGRLFVVSGDHFYEVFYSTPTVYTFVDRSIPGFPGASGSGPAGGSVGNDGLPVQMFANGNQLLIISAGQAYIDNGNGPYPLQYSDQLTDLIITDLSGGVGTRTFTDLYTLGAATEMGSLSYRFTAADVGLTVTITGGTGWLPGTYTISSLLLGPDGTPNGVANMSGAVASVNTSGGQGTENLTAPIALTDLFTQVPATVMGSLTRVFSAVDVGKTMTITSGSGWLVGAYTIESLVLGPGGTPNGLVVMSAPVAAPDSTAGHGTESGSTGLQNLLNNISGNLFSNSDVGRTVQITGGAGFIIQSQVITAVQNGGALAANSWGIVGSQGGTGIEWLSPAVFTDLFTLGIPNLMGSLSYQFGQSDIGRTIIITGGSGWIPGSYTITGLVLGGSGQPNGVAIMSGNVAGPSAQGGQGTELAQSVTASQGAFLDGYFFIVPSPRTKTIYFSAINDGTSWSLADFFTKANYPDNVNALFSDHEELYTFGDLQSTQVWRNTGNLDSPFQPDPGAVSSLCCQAAFSVCRLGNGVAWLGGDVTRGERVAFQSVGFNPQRVSTPAVEAQWAKYPRVDDAVACNVSLQGHEIWVITFPAANITWAYDANTAFWFKWGYFNGCGFERTRWMFHGVVDLIGTNTEQHYVGDWGNGNLYILSMDYKDDNGQIIKRQRRAPHMTRENSRRFYSRFRLDCDVLGTVKLYWLRLGMGRDREWQLQSSQDAGGGTTHLTLMWSDDSGQTFKTMPTQDIPGSIDVSICNAYIDYGEGSQ